MSYQRALAFACASALAPGLAAAQSAGAHAPGGPTPALHRPHRAELAGRALAGYPFFERVRVLHAGSALQMAVDPLLLPELAGSPADVYVVAAKSAAEWQSDRTLVDVRAGGPQAVLFGGGGVQGNTFTLDAGLLSGDAGTGLGVPYDVVIDTDFDGLLGDGDVIDGAGAEAGVYVVRDTSQLGPLVPIELTYDLSASTFDAQNTFYPANIAALGKLPVVIVSHGNGHNYQWYDHIGRHLASYGYVVMSHENNTGPGSDAASITTLTNAEKLFANQATIGGGVLNGHLDGDHIVFVGHSRGGEGVVRAYTRLVNDEFTTPFFDQDDIRLVVSISPVTHIDSSLSDPGTVNYALMYGAADADVTGTPSLSASKPFAFYERAEGDKSVFYIQGVGHAYFHNGGGSCVCTGPAILPQAEVHDYELGYLLALVKRYVDGSVPARDFLERMEGDLRPWGWSAAPSPRRSTARASPPGTSSSTTSRPTSGWRSRARGVRCLGQRAVPGRGPDARPGRLVRLLGGGHPQRDDALRRLRGTPAAARCSSGARRGRTSTSSPWCRPPATCPTTPGSPCAPARARATRRPTCSTDRCPSRSRCATCTGTRARS
jgi:dienelactone hydrolase